MRSMSRWLTLHFEPQTGCRRARPASPFLMFGHCYALASLQEEEDIGKERGTDACARSIHPSGKPSLWTCLIYMLHRGRHVYKNHAKYCCVSCCDLQYELTHVVLLGLARLHLQNTPTHQYIAHDVNS